MAYVTAFYFFLLYILKAINPPTVARAIAPITIKAIAQPGNSPPTSIEISKLTLEKSFCAISWVFKSSDKPERVLI